MEIPDKEDKEELEKFKKEFEKYLQRDGKEKKVYSVSLTKENVDYLKGRLKAPFSKFVDDVLATATYAFKRLDEEKKKESETKKEGNGDAKEE